jgi:hypothetical protein
LHGCPDDQRFEKALFPKWAGIAVRFDDVDAEGQIGANAIATLFREGRRRFNMTRVAA